MTSAPVAACLIRSSHLTLIPALPMLAMSLTFPQPWCPNDCGGHGKCVRSRKVVEGAGGLSNVSVEVSEARCECVKGWGGANCSVAGPDTCHQRGRCLLTSADLAPQGMALRLDAALAMAARGRPR